MDDSYLYRPAFLRMDQRLRSQLLVWRDGYLQPVDTFWYADSMDRDKYRAGICHRHARRQVLRHLRIHHLCPIATVAICHDIQSTQHQRLTIMARTGSPATATGGVCQIRHRTGVGQVHVGIWL